MVFEIGERILPISVTGRSHRLVIEIDDPLILFGINRGFPRQGQPHEAERALRPNTFAAREEGLAEQGLRLEMPFIRGENSQRIEPDPTSRLAPMLAA
jgi:hypothetical protein